MLKLKRAYEPASQEDGQRFLVERLWPRGVKKTSLHFDAWLQRLGSDRTLPDVVPVRLDKAAETLPISWDHDRTTGAVRHWAQHPSARHRDGERFSSRRAAIISPRGSVDHPLDKPVRTHVSP